MMIGRGGGAKNKVTRNMEGREVTSLNPTLSYRHPNGGGYVDKAVGKGILFLSNVIELLQMIGLYKVINYWL